MSGFDDRVFISGGRHNLKLSKENYKSNYLSKKKKICQANHIA